MRAARSLVPTGLVLSGVLVAIGLACGSSSGPLGDASGDGGGEGDGGGGDGGVTDITDSGAGATDSPISFIVDSSPPDTGLPLNMVNDAEVPEGGLAVHARVISCGPQMTCNAFAAVQCCLGDDGGTCFSTSVSCPAGAASTRCNESADCVIGTVCCGDVVVFDAGNAGVSALCTKTCAAPRPQLCRTNGECPEGGPCVPQTCSDGNQYEFCGVYGAGDDGGGAFSCTAN